MFTELPVSGKRSAFGTLAARCFALVSVAWIIIALTTTAKNILSVEPVLMESASKACFTTPRSKFGFDPRISEISVRTVDQGCLRIYKIEKTESELLQNALVKVFPNPHPQICIFKTVTVKVRVLVDSDGTVINAQSENGHPVFRSYAAHAAEQWRFRPFQAQGVNVLVEGTLTFTFQRN